MTTFYFFIFYNIPLNIFQIQIKFLCSTICVNQLVLCVAFYFFRGQFTSVIFKGLTSALISAPPCLPTLTHASKYHFQKIEVDRPFSTWQKWGVLEFTNGLSLGVYINAKFAINLLYSYKKNLAIKSLCIFYKPRL